MLNVRTTLRDFVMILQSTALIFAAQPTMATEPQTPAAPTSGFPDNAKEFFISTEPIQTENGPTHIEVKSYIIESQADLDRVAEIELRNTQNTLSNGESEYIEMDLTQTRGNRLSRNADSLMNQMESMVNATHVAKYTWSDLGADLRRDLVSSGRVVGNVASHNYTLTFFRLLLAGGATATGVAKAHHLGLFDPAPMMMGLLMGSASASVQFGINAYMSWIRNSYFLVNQAKRLGWIVETVGPVQPGVDRYQRGGRLAGALHETEMQLKWGGTEATFLLVAELGFLTIGMPTHNTVAHFLTLLGSTWVSQGFYDIGINKFLPTLRSMYPNINERLFVSVGAFAGSGVSVLSAILVMNGVAIGNLGFVVLAAAGAVLTFGPKLQLRATVAQIVERVEAVRRRASNLRRAVRTCRSLFAN